MRNFNFLCLCLCFFLAQCSSSRFPEKEHSVSIFWINPVGTDVFDSYFRTFLNENSKPETRIEVVSLETGPFHLEYHSYNTLVGKDTLNMIRKAELQGYDAAIIGCFYDPFLEEARELTKRMLVMAPAESSLHIATTLGTSFSIIVGRKKWIPKMKDNVHKYGFEKHLASFKSIDMGVHEFQANTTETERRLTQAALDAVNNDNAEVIILGCTIEFGFFRHLQDILGVPVIDAAAAALTYTEMAVQLHRQYGWFHSKVYGYESPPDLEIESWGLFDQDGDWGKSDKKC